MSLKSVKRDFKLGLSDRNLEEGKSTGENQPTASPSPFSSHENLQAVCIYRGWVFSRHHFGYRDGLGTRLRTSKLDMR